MPDFKNRLSGHIEHVKVHGHLCSTEETTKQALILPFLDILGFSPFDPNKVRAEYAADMPGIKAGERVDYSLFVEGLPVMFIEAKPYTEKLTNHARQMARYFNATPGVKIAALTNGLEWRFFTDLADQNIMDSVPFLSVRFDEFGENDHEKLANFRYDRFQPDRLKSFAEERSYLDNFTRTIGSLLREVDQDFVKFVATRANMTSKLTPKFLETITPLVKQAVAEAISGMVVSGLSVPQAPQQQAVEATGHNEDQPGNWIDPANPKIVTTPAERKLFEIAADILDGQVDENDLTWKDTESYFGILYQNKVNRWLVRYVGERKNPLLTFGIELNDQHRALVKRAGLEMSGNNIILTRPENLMKLSPILFDALAYCKDDENFRVKKKEGPAVPVA